MSDNPETLRLYAKIFEMPRYGSRETNPICRAAAKALRFRADYIAREGEFEPETGVTSYIVKRAGDLGTDNG